MPQARVWVGGRDVVAGRMTGSELSAFVFYALLLANSGAAASELWGEVQRAAAAAAADRPTGGTAGEPPRRHRARRAAAASPSRLGIEVDRAALERFRV